MGLWEPPATFPSFLAGADPTPPTSPTLKSDHFSSLDKPGITRPLKGEEAGQERRGKRGGREGGMVGGA